MAHIKSQTEANGPYGLNWNEDNGYVQEVSEETTGVSGQHLDHLVRDLKGIDGFSEVSAPEASEAFSEVSTTAENPFPPEFGPGSGKAVWLEYAEHVGVMVDNSMSYADIVKYVTEQVGLRTTGQ